MNLLQKVPKWVLKLYFEAMNVFIALCFLDLAVENETSSQRHFHNKLETICHCERLFENLKNDLIASFQSFISTDTLKQF